MEKKPFQEAGELAYSVLAKQLVILSHVATWKIHLMKETVGLGKSVHKVKYCVAFS